MERGNETGRDCGGGCAKFEVDKYAVRVYLKSGFHICSEFLNGFKHPGLGFSMISDMQC